VFDAVTSATPLAAAKFSGEMTPLWRLFIGNISGSGPFGADLGAEIRSVFTAALPPPRWRFSNWGDIHGNGSDHFPRYEVRTVDFWHRGRSHHPGNKDLGWLSGRCHVFDPADECIPALD